MATDYPDAMRKACREAAYLLAGEWGLSLEDAFILLSIRADVGVAQARKPSPFATVARVVMPRLQAPGAICIASTVLTKTRPVL